MSRSVVGPNFIASRRLVTCGRIALFFLFHPRLWLGVGSSGTFGLRPILHYVRCLRRTKELVLIGFLEPSARKLSDALHPLPLVAKGRSLRDSCNFLRFYYSGEEIKTKFLQHKEKLGYNNHAHPP